MTNSAGIAAIQAVGLLHAQGYELLRVWVTARSERVLLCNVHLFTAGLHVADVLNFEADHIALSYDYGWNANAVVEGKIYPDFDPVGNGLADGDWSRPEKMAKYLLRNYADFSQTWRGADGSYVEWFRKLVRFADQGELPVMQLQSAATLDLSLGAVMVEGYAPSRQLSLFASEQ